VPTRSESKESPPGGRGRTVANGTRGKDPRISSLRAGRTGSIRVMHLVMATRMPSSNLVRIPSAASRARAGTSR
jgi:hypothetical protein